MKLTFLGTSSGLAVPDRNASAILIEHEGQSLLMDAGEGTARQMARYDVDPHALAAVFISHTHPDHAGGITGLLQYLHLNDRKTDINLFIPESLVPGFQALLPLFHIYPGKWPFDINVRPLEPLTVLDFNIKIEAVRNTHVDGYAPYARPFGYVPASYSFAVLESDQIKAIITSDIDNFDHLTSRYKQVPCLISEYTHVDLETIRKTAGIMQCKQIILTHIPEPHDIPDVKMIMAHDGYTMEI